MPIKTDEHSDEDMIIQKEEALKPDLVNDADFKSIEMERYDIGNQSTGRSFLLMDAKENLHIATPELFCRKLHCTDSDKIKVVSIFGNTGDGKSHTMNNTFFAGENVFKTSSEQNSCTIGVYAAMQHEMGVLCLDTEGLLGTTASSNRRMRMLLKILAISDIVIYRTRSERLHKDMYEFLATASKAFCSHFAQALQSFSISGTAKTLGPAVIIFHETRHTKPLESSVEESSEDKLRENFSRLKLDTNAFSSLRYVGIQTDTNESTDFSKINAAIRMEIENTSVRSPRQPGVVFKAMKALNLKFSGEIVEKTINPFPEQYFTCPAHCKSCSRRCQRSMGHELDGETHMCPEACYYQHQFENKVNLCKSCYNNGRKIIVTTRKQTQSDNTWYGLVKYAWKGAVIECTNCGEIYRTRQYWYGNQSPELTCVRTEIVHVWRDENMSQRASIHSAQMVLDSVSYLSDAISNISAQPTRAITGLVADLVAPSYWKPNHEIIHCFACKKNFDKTGLRKHHCRGCGEGFCHSCSSHEMPVPARGWTQAVRVCNDCRHELQRKEDCTPENGNEQTINHSNHNNTTTNTGPPQSSDEADILVRKYGETIYNTISSVAAVALEYPKGFIKDSARPSYWVPDAESPRCSICNTVFGTAEEVEIAKTKKSIANTCNGNVISNGDIDAGGGGVNGSSGGGGNGNDGNVLNGNVIGGTNTNNEVVISIVQHKKLMGDCKRHHCRRCGQAICSDCSKTRRPVPERGWQTEVRVCDSCACVEIDAEVKSKLD